MRIQKKVNNKLGYTIFFIAFLVLISFLVPNYKGSLTLKLLGICGLVLYYLYVELRWNIISLEIENDVIKVEMSFFFNLKGKYIEILKSDLRYKSKDISSGNFKGKRKIYYFKIDSLGEFKIDPLDSWEIKKVEDFLRINHFKEY